MSNQEVVKYILDTYPEYIDNLRIIDLKNLLLKDSNIEEDTYIWDLLRSLMQLIVNECGSDIVNDIDLRDNIVGSYYSGVLFYHHVNVKKDNIQPYEFSYAEFADGITIQSKKLPRGSLMGAKMCGTVDLTSVEILESDNLNYRFTEDCTVKLSKNLKEIEAGSFVVNMSNKPRIEYDGFVSEFNELIENNISRWVSDIRKNTFISIMKMLDIKCTDGTWTSELISSDE